MRTRSFLRIILFAFCSIGSVDSAFNQVPSQLRSTLSSGAANILDPGCTNKYSVIQSIGQSSVIGIFNSDKMYVCQGFLHPSVLKTVGRYDNSENTITYPNPSFGSFSVLIPGESRNRLNVLMMSIEGRVILSGLYPPSHEITLNPGSIPAGMYIIRIVADKKVYTCRIIRK